jgi:hypothetical protein
VISVTCRYLPARRGVAYDPYMRVARIVVALLLAASFALVTAGQALAIRDPIIVCVREPCGPGLPDLPPLP